MTVATTQRILPHVWVLTVADLEKLCGQPIDRPAGEVLVADVEGLCRGALADGQRRGMLPIDIERGDWLEVLGFLLGEVCVRGRKYDPARRGIEFRPWLYEQLRGFAVEDAQRWLYGRDRRHRLPELAVAANGLRDSSSAGGTYSGEGYVGFDDGTPLNDPVDPASLVDQADRVDARRWLEAEADRAGAGAVGVGGVGVSGAVAAGDRSAGAGARGRAAGGGGGSAHWRDCLTCGWRTYAQAPNGKPGWHLPQACGGCGVGFEAAA